VFDWLFEGRSTVYWLIGVLAVILLLVWWRTRKHNLLLAAGAIVALAGVYFLLGQFMETPRKQIERKLHEMAAAVKARDTEGIFKHIAKDFKFRDQDRAQFRTYVDNALQHGIVTELVIYDEEWPDGGDDHVRPVEFKAKPTVPSLGDQPAYPVTAKFVRESDGQWRLQSFQVYNPISGKEPMNIPNMP
jgi:ketosteroid isomerase-like protein